METDDTDALGVPPGEARTEVERLTAQLARSEEEKERILIELASWQVCGRKASDARMKAERKAQEALDDPDRVWANQRRVLRRENRALINLLGSERYTRYKAEVLLRQSVSETVSLRLENEKLKVAAAKSAPVVEAAREWREHMRDIPVRYALPVAVLIDAVDALDREGD